MEPLSSHQHVFRSLFLPLSRTSCSLSRHLLDNFPRGMVGSRLAPLQVTRSPLRFFLAFYTSCPSPPLSSPLECSTLYLFKFPCITHICLHNSFMTISICMSMTPGDSSRFTTSPLFSAFFSANTLSNLNTIWASVAASNLIDLWAAHAAWSANARGCQADECDLKWPLYRHAMSKCRKLGLGTRWGIALSLRTHMGRGGTDRSKVGNSEIWQLCRSLGTLIML